jgi:hypothetical protein
VPGQVDSLAGAMPGVLRGVNDRRDQAKAASLPADLWTTQRLSIL